MCCLKCSGEVIKMVLESLNVKFDIGEGVVDVEVDAGVEGWKGD